MAAQPAPLQWLFLGGEWPLLAPSPVAVISSATGFVRNGDGALTFADILAPQRRRQRACEAGHSDHSRMRCGMPLPQAKSPHPARCSLQRAARRSSTYDAHDSIAAVLFLLLIVTASYAQAPWAPLVSYGLVGKCTQVARSPCCSSASVPTSSRAAQPTLVRSTSPCIYVCYTHSTIAPQARPPRSSSVLATHTSMCYMRTTCMCICRSCAERHACSSHMCGAALT